MLGKGIHGEDTLMPGVLWFEKVTLTKLYQSIPKYDNYYWSSRNVLLS